MESYAWFSICKGGGERLSDWKYCLSFLRFFSISVFSWVTVISALAKGASHALRLVRFFYSTEMEVSSS